MPSRPILAASPRLRILAGAARHFEIDAAQRFAVEADDGAELDVEVDVDRPLGGLARRAAARRGLDEVAAVIDVAAHDHAQRAVRRAFDLEADAVAVGETVGRKVGRLQFAGAVEFDRSLDAAAGAFDQKIVDADRLRLGRQREGRARRLAGRLHPARHQAVDLRRREIGLDGETAFAVGPRADAAGQADRYSAADAGAGFEAEIVARRLVQHALDADFGVGLVAHLAVFEVRRRAADLDVALDLEALRRGARAQQRRLDFLPHDEVIGGEIGRVDGDAVRGRSRRRIGPQRQSERNLRGHVAAHGCRIERQVRDVAQPIHVQQLDRGRSRTLDLEADPRRRRVQCRVGHFERTGRST